MAFVVHYDAGGSPDFTCSGTVVASNVVMTAGHCVVDESTGVQLDPSGFRVITGAVDWTNTAARQINTVSRAVVYPGFDLSTGLSDAGLLVLTTPITAPAIKLATGADQNLEQAGTGALIAGWGETYAGSDTPSNLQWAETVVQSRTYCARFNLFPFVYSPSLNLCSVDYPYDDTAFCSGDSGGPLIAGDATGQPIQIGITSHGPTDCNTNTADYYTTVRPISGWVAAWMNAVAPPPPPLPPPSPPAVPQLPEMSSSAAHSYVRKTLAGVLRRPFADLHSYKTHCSRRSTTRFSCKFSFWTGPSDYWGRVVVDYVLAADNQVNWTDDYVNHWVNDYCYYSSGHRSRCRFHTERGTY